MSFKAKFINGLFVSIMLRLFIPIWWICNHGHFNFTFYLCGDTIIKGCLREYATNNKCPHRCLQTVICSCRGYWELLVYWEVRIREFHLGCLACTVSPEANKQWIFYFPPPFSQSYSASWYCQGFTYSPTNALVSCLKKQY